MRHIGGGASTGIPAGKAGFFTATVNQCGSFRYARSRRLPMTGIDSPVIFPARSAHKPRKYEFASYVNVFDLVFEREVQFPEVALLV